MIGAFPDSDVEVRAVARDPAACRRSVRAAGTPRHVFCRLRPGHRCGASATEFAIVAPVFFLMIIGFIEFGRALMVEQVLVNASRVGAREASTTTGTTTGVVSAVQEYSTGMAVPGVTVNVTPNPASAKPGTTITVTTSVPFNNVSWMASPWFLGGKTLSASSKMRKEGFN